MGAPDEQPWLAALGSAGAGLRSTLEKLLGRQTDLRVVEEIRGRNSLGFFLCHRQKVSGAGVCLGVKHPAWGNLSEPLLSLARNEFRFGGLLSTAHPGNRPAAIPPTSTEEAR
jgi:hypothetical protein